MLVNHISTIPNTQRVSFTTSAIKKYMIVLTSEQLNPTFLGLNFQELDAPKHSLAAMATGGGGGQYLTLQTQLIKLLYHKLMLKSSIVRLLGLTTKPACKPDGECDYL
jgi:hypothetical protein